MASSPSSTKTPPLFDEAFLRQLDRLALIARRPMAGEMQGERRSPRRGPSVEFADYKPYVAGDDFRQIDWNLYARAERFFLKLFVAEEELTLHLVLDTSRSMDWGDPNKLRYAKRVAGALGYIALSNLDRVALSAFGHEREVRMPAQRSRRGALPLFRFLEDLAPGSGTDFAGVCRRYARTARTTGPLLLCSDLMDPGWQEGLRALIARRFEVTVIHTLAPQEVDPDMEGDVRLIDSEGGAPIDLTADVDLLRRYSESLQAWREEITAYCSSHDIAYVPLETSLPIEELLLSLLRRRGVVR
jgi:uncharacterized protein (DUF58 family)